MESTAFDRTLDTVSTERQPQNEAMIQLAIELGQVLCQLDLRAQLQMTPTLAPTGALS
jgi:hypothetical protein